MRCIVKRHIVSNLCARMTPADTYRKLAAELKAKAANEANSTLAAEWDHLAQCYLRLARQAD